MKEYIKKSAPFVLVIYTIIVTTLSLISLPQINDTEPMIGLDKIVHFCFYFGMSTIILTTLWIRSKGITIGHSLKTLFITLVFSILIEIIQPYFGRTFDLDDIIANSIGNIVGIVMVTLIYRHKNYFK